MIYQIALQEAINALEWEYTSLLKVSITINTMTFKRRLYVEPVTQKLVVGIFTIESTDTAFPLRTGSNETSHYFDDLEEAVKFLLA